MPHILFVCMGNICRSPMAEAVAQGMAARLPGAQPKAAFWHKPLWVFDSAGTHAGHLGERPDPRALDALARRGYAPGKQRSRQVNLRDFEKFDLILAMDADNLQNLQRQCPPTHEHKLRLFMSFAPGKKGVDVPDPYYGSAAGFEPVLDLCEAGVDGLLKGHRAP
jgi:protein-tyrosine phosphatase